MKVTNYNGGVSVQNAISAKKIQLDTYNGNVRNCFRGRDFGYIAYGRATSHNGNVDVK